jgi:hypothetical protein
MLRILNNLGKHEEAIRCCEMALTIDPDNRQAMDNKHKLQLFNASVKGDGEGGRHIQ